MLMTELRQIIEQISKLRKIEENVLINAIKDALKAAAKKKYGNEIDIEIHYNEENGEIEAFQFKEVVEDIENDINQISLEEAEILDSECKLGDSLGVKMDTLEFGRIAAQSAKQVILHKVRNAEQEKIYSSYKDKKGTIVHGTVQRISKGDIIVNLSNAEGILPAREQMPGDFHNRVNSRIRTYVLDVISNERGTQIILSRTHPNFLINLFKTEVPEVSDGLVFVLGATRIPGIRAKVAVQSQDPNVDPVGACVGMRGNRVQNVVQELKGEKIDIIPWNENPVKFVCNALAPAEVTRVVLDEENRNMDIIVPDDSLSIAIGKKGQNVKLASQLTGWRLDVKTESDYSKVMKNGYDSLMSLPSVGMELADSLSRKGFFSAEEISNASIEELVKIESVSEEIALNLINAAAEFIKNKKNTQETVNNKTFDESEEIKNLSE
jgi:transcription termination/antitermination protein NusA